MPLVTPHFLSKKLRFYIFIVYLNFLDVNIKSNIFRYFALIHDNIFIEIRR
nr:MAG TPA: hypothetical protein [Caudoviricetes sp.]